MIRALFTAAIEYTLAYIIFKKGKTTGKVIAIILFFLASYQLGEVIMFATDGGEIGFRLAYFSTTLLPALGLELLEKITGKRHYYLPLQIIGVIFALVFLIQPALLAGFERETCCFIAANYTDLGRYWVYYYQGTLLFTMLAIMINIFLKYKRHVKVKLSYMLLGYIIIESGVFIAYFNPLLNQSTASVMCAVAIFAALLFARIGLMKEEK